MRPGAAGGGRSPQHVLHTEDAGRPQVPAAISPRRVSHGAFDEEFDRLGGAFPPHGVSCRVAYLLGRFDDSEQVVDRHELEDRNATEPIGEFRVREPVAGQAAVAAAR